ncbi:PTH2-domain-containing protein [Xylaria bambusicola]|uniref:PTH2-domain-containing protein n=1 Tax=Xylaria bambusicola TaxID=326684 RepID=UPI002008091D|nr:PTH2-domain-containing protein [Xylaria bambusicola]KAI0518314.1 PTH2-domain-containing protein [Xylaria bambusicola]
MAESTSLSTALIATSLVAFFSGFGLGIYSIRGYIVPPSLTSQRQRTLNDPIESDESDVDEDDTVLDHAPNWANGAEADTKQGLRTPGPRKDEGEKKQAGDDVDAEAKSAKREAETAHPRQAAVNPGSNPNEECKLVLVVRTDLGMTKGKIAAQCSHATLACYKTLSRSAARRPTSAEAKILQRWERLGQAKIAVQVKSQDELLTLMGKARSLGVTAEVIQDAGRTQIDPGSLTVLGVGPAPKSLVDQITGGLKLL